MDAPMRTPGRRITGSPIGLPWGFLDSRPDLGRNRSPAWRTGSTYREARTRGVGRDRIFVQAIPYRTGYLCRKPRTAERESRLRTLVKIRRAERESKPPS